MSSNRSSFHSTSQLFVVLKCVQKAAVPRDFEVYGCWENIEFARDFVLANTIEYAFIKPVEPLDFWLDESKVRPTEEPHVMVVDKWEELGVIGFLATGEDTQRWRKQALREQPDLDLEIFRGPLPIYDCAQYPNKVLLAHSGINHSKSSKSPKRKRRLK